MDGKQEKKGMPACDASRWRKSASKHTTTRRKKEKRLHRKKGKKLASASRGERGKGKEKEEEQRNPHRTPGIRDSYAKKKKKKKKKKNLLHANHLSKRKKGGSKRPDYRQPSLPKEGVAWGRNSVPFRSGKTEKRRVSGLALTFEWRNIKKTCWREK